MKVGTIALGNIVTLDNNQIIYGAKQFLGMTGFPPKVVQTLAATAAIEADTTQIRVGGSGGAVTLTSEPNIADGFDGQFILIRGTDNTNTLTIQDVGTLAGSNVDLGGANRTLGNGDYLALIFNADTGLWEELFFKNN